MPISGSTWMASLMTGISPWSRSSARGSHAAGWIEATVPEGILPGVCFFDLGDDSRSTRITDFWPEPYGLPASRTHLVERY